MKKVIRRGILSLLIFVSMATSVWSQKQSDHQKMNVFIKDLMKKMTLEEKLGQMNLITPVSITGPFATKNAVL